MVDRQGKDRHSMRVGYGCIRTVFVFVEVVRRVAVVVTERCRVAVIMVGQRMVMCFPARHAGQHQSKQNPRPEQQAAAMGQSASTWREKVWHQISMPERPPVNNDVLLASRRRTGTAASRPGGVKTEHGVGAQGLHGFRASSRNRFCVQKHT